MKVYRIVAQPKPEQQRTRYSVQRKKRFIWSYWSEIDWEYNEEAARNTFNRFVAAAHNEESYKGIPKKVIASSEGITPSKEVVGDMPK